MLDITKPPFETKDGRRAILLDSLKSGHEFLVSDSSHDTLWRKHFVATDGVAPGDKRYLDVVNTKAKHKLTGFLNVDDKDDIYFTAQKWNDRDFADSFQMGKRIACIPIELEYEEGEGIEKPGD